ncbi:PIN domain-containing protein [Paracoccus caeni]|uniref:PIN domain-containing protein n=1 Tax=Paracoccus caeni TaxID=657651 RepID=A0A934SM14_9RHOB|nr:PIN domain-containing protein [Paracoccus caeni]MBK4216823.1 PIN domain-containing protein [Paracoccus caeni]
MRTAIDTNVLLYLLDDGPKARLARDALANGGVISVQVLNEITTVCRRKAGMSWDEIRDFLGLLREVLSIADLTAAVHDIGRAVAERYQLSVYDAMIVASALANGCERLLSEDMQDGMMIEGRLRIENPFAGQ